MDMDMDKDMGMNKGCRNKYTFPFCDEREKYTDEIK